MTIDQAGLDFIKGWESFRPSAYNDIAGYPTIGYGHLIKPSEEFPGTITLSQAETLLWSDLEPVEEAITRLCPQANQNQFNALCSFGFNLGVGSLETMLGHGWDQVPAQVLRWDHAGGKQVAGLTRRRQAESELFCTPA